MSGPYDAARMNAVAWLEGLPAPQRWREIAHVHGPRIATWALALLIGVQAALIITDLAGVGGAPVGAASPPLPATRQAFDVAAITNSHLFGAKAADTPTADATNAPQTSAPLVLTGIIAGEDPATGLAILGESASSAKVYATGNAIPGGVKLHSVYSDRVLLDRNGSLESLRLPSQYAQGGAGAQTAPLPTASPDAVDAPAERVRRLIAEQPGSISEVMRPQAVFAQGKQRGYRVYPGRNRQAFVRLGLRPGDLVTAINGTPLDDPARGQEIFQTLGSSSEARVTVMRNGRQQDLSLNMSQVAQQAEQISGQAEAPQAEESDAHFSERDSGDAQGEE
jgi:general secretion pathway protein C